MERKDFLKNGFGFLGMALVSPGILNLTKSDAESACVLTRTETEGPFPTITLQHLKKLKLQETGQAFLLPYRLLLKTQTAIVTLHPGYW